MFKFGGSQSQNPKSADPLNFFLVKVEGEHMICFVAENIELIWCKKQKQKQNKTKQKNLVERGL